MPVIEITRAGGPEVLVAAHRPVPRPEPDELLIEVAAAGVNRPDVMQRQGRYPPPPGASDIPGLEVAGRVAMVGRSAGEWSVGQAVCALVTGGGYAAYCAAPAAQCLSLPEALTMVEGAAVPEAFFTVWANLFERGRLAAGETVLVHGGSSGIGTTALQLARAFGAEVFTTAGSPRKRRACEALGAALAIDYRTEDFVAAVKQATHGRGVDVVLDMVGGTYVQRNIDVLAVDGRLVQIAMLEGPKAEINLIPILQRRLTLTGSTLRPRSVEEKATIACTLRERVWPLLAAGRIKPIVDSTYPLAQASCAHRRMESSEHIGKLVLTVR